MATYIKILTKNTVSHSAGFGTWSFGVQAAGARRTRVRLLEGTF